MKALTIVSFILVIVGALNWLLVGLAQFNLVNALFGGAPVLEQLIYIIVGLAGIFLATRYKRIAY